MRHAVDTSVNFLDLLPNHLIAPQQKERLKKLSHHLDRLGKIDQESKQAFIDENALRHLIKDFAKQFPSNSEEQIVSVLKASPEHKLVSTKDAHFARLSAVSWAELGRYIPVFDQTAATAAIETQIDQFSDASTVDDLKAKLHQLAPGISDSMLEPETFTQVIERASQALVRPTTATASAGPAAAANVGDVFNCFVRHWGWWGAAIAVAVLIALGTALGVLGPFTVIIGAVTVGVVSGYVIAGIIAGGGAAAVMLLCILNPFG